MEKPKREIALAIPFNKVLGYDCPICKSVGIGAAWAEGTNYCPKCGQRIKLVSVENGSWNELVKDACKIPNVRDTDIVTTHPIAVAGGFEEIINGVYLNLMRKYFSKSDQVEGQLSMFD